MSKLFENLSDLFKNEGLRDEFLQIWGKMPVHEIGSLSEEERHAVSALEKKLFGLFEQAISSSTNTDNIIHDGHGEYIIYRQEGNEIFELEREEHLAVYHLLCKYQFPGCTDTVNGAAAELSESELHELFNHQAEFIRKQLKALNSTIELVFIPRTLYELCFLSATLSETQHLNPDNIYYLDSDLYNNLAKYYNPSLCSDSKSDRGSDDIEIRTKQYFKEVENFFRQASNSGYKFRTNNFGFYDRRRYWPRIKNYEKISLETLSKNTESAHHTLINVHRELNNYILGLVKQKSQEPQEFRFGQIQLMTLERFVSICKIVHSKEFYSNIKDSSLDVSHLEFNSPKNIISILNALQVETDSSLLNQFLLYRGQEAKRCSELQAHYSRSYGTGLFAGSIYDLEATPYNHMNQVMHLFLYTEKDSEGFIVPIDKLAYYKGDVPLLIPYAHTLLQLLSSGDFFHARSLIFPELIEKDQRVRGFDTYEKYPAFFNAKLNGLNKQPLKRLNELHNHRIQITRSPSF